MLKEGEDPSVYCTKLTDFNGNEHIILVLNKYAKIDFEDGSNIVRYEFGGKSKKVI